MSKLSQLKQEAYQAGKKRDWELAVSIYERILEIDKSNPMVINEMGDLCLKADETPRAIRHFLSAASRYRSTGLLNNAVAIYKKILRYDADNQNAHWYLAETRASQGLLVEGREHAIRFLDGGDSISGDLKEIFLKRCGQLFDLYAGSRPLLEKLLPIYRTWDLHLEAARTRSLLACFSFEEGEVDAAREAMQDIAARNPEVQNYPEFQKLRKLLVPGSVDQARATADVNALSLDDPAPAPTAPAAPDDFPEPATPDPSPIASESALVDADPFGMGIGRSASPKPVDVSDADESADESADEAPTIEIPVEPDAGETSFAEVAGGILGDEADFEAPEIEIDEDGCFELSLDDDGASFEDLVAQAASDVEPEDAPAEDSQPQPLEVDGDPGCDVEEETPVAPPVDRLAEILSSDKPSAGGSDDSQVAAITSDIGAQVGGDAQDAASLYEMGLVYLDMGLFDQAVDSFEKAAGDEEYSIRALEMTGIALLKAQRPAAAVEALQRGRTQANQGTREQLGILYHLAQAHEQNDQETEALSLYQEICDTDAEFLDVRDRLSRLARV